MDSPTVIETLSRPPTETEILDLARVLVDAVDSGAAVSFVAPFSLDQAAKWWREHLATLDARAIVLVSRDREGIVGTVSLIPAWAPNQPHRAEIAKLMVHRRARNAGFGARLMTAAEDRARIEGFELLTLDAKSGGAAERLYRRLGWEFAGSIPRYALDTDGVSFHATSIFYKELRPTAEEELWRTYDAMEARLTAGVSEAMIAFAGLRPGDSVLDLAAGRGEPAIRAASRVAPDGRVLGIDVSAAMLKMARERARVSGIDNLDLRVMDAESLAGIPDRSFDAVLARWCVMYFAAPERAFVEARRVLRPGGRFVLAVWAEPERVPYVTLPRAVLARSVALPPIDRSVPGTFRFAEPSALEETLVAAGFEIVGREEIEVPVMDVATGEEFVTWCKAFGVGRVLRDQSDETRHEFERELAAEGERIRRDGRIRLGGVTRIVTAVVPRSSEPDGDTSCSTTP